MNKITKSLLLTAILGVVALPLLSQTSSGKKPAFEVVSIKPSAPLGAGPIRIGEGTRGDRYTTNSSTLRMLLEQAYSKNSNAGPGGQIELIGGPSWIDSDRYDIEATADCNGGVLSRAQWQLMIQSMLEDRFHLKAHMETREFPIYNLVVAKDGPKIKASEDQTPPPIAAGPPQPCAPASDTPAPPVPPPPPPAPGRGPEGERSALLNPNVAMVARGGMVIMFTREGFVFRGSAVPISTLVGSLQQQIGRPIIDKTGLKGLFDFILQFSPEGLKYAWPPGIPQPLGPAGGGAGPTPASAADPIPSVFTSIQDLGLRLESAKGPVEVLVVDSAQKPPEN